MPKDTRHCIDSLRHNEYYDMQDVYDELYKKSKKFYETYGKPMIEKNFPEYVSKIAVGLVGEGSDCFGFDDEKATRRNPDKDKANLIRTPFIRDIDKIMHCPYYNRYADKTQVFSFYKSPRIYPIAFLHTGQTSRAFSEVYSNPQFSHFHFIGCSLL